MKLLNLHFAKKKIFVCFVASFLNWTGSITVFFNSRVCNTQIRDRGLGGNLFHHTIVSVRFSLIHS